MNTVYIRGLKARSVIGVYDWERDIRQTLVLDMELGSDVRTAARYDQIADALDYAAISSAVLALVEVSQFQLIESLAEAVAALLQEQFAVPWLRLRISKPGAVVGALDVGVIIERGARS